MGGMCDGVSRPDDSDVCVACNNCKHSNNLDLNNTSLLNNKRKRASAAAGDKQPSSLLSRSRVTRVCSGINGMCIDSPDEMVFTITFFNEVTGNDETWHNVVAKLLDTPLTSYWGYLIYGNIIC